MSDRDKQIIKEFIKKNWRADFQSQEEGAEWLGRFLEFYKKCILLPSAELEFLRKFAKELEKGETDE